MVQPGNWAKMDMRPALAILRPVNLIVLYIDCSTDNLINDDFKKNTTQNFIHAIITSTHFHSYGTAYYLQLWADWWAIVGCRSAIKPKEWPQLKNRINNVISRWKAMKALYDMYVLK